MKMQRQRLFTGMRRILFALALGALLPAAAQASDITRTMPMKPLTVQRNTTPHLVLPPAKLSVTGTNVIINPFCKGPQAALTVNVNIHNTGGPLKSGVASVWITEDGPIKTAGGKAANMRSNRVWVPALKRGGGTVVHADVTSLADYQYLVGDHILTLHYASLVPQETISNPVGRPNIPIATLKIHALVPVGHCATHLQKPAMTGMKATTGFQPHFTYSKITGHVEISGCKTTMQNVRLLVNGKTSPNLKVSHFPNEPNWYKFELSKLLPGQYTLQPGIVGSTCQKGHWNPAKASIAISPGSAPRQTFYFQNLPKSMVISSKLIVPIINTLFKGMKIHLNSYGPEHKGSWEKTQSSYIKPGSLLGGGSLSFTIPEAKQGPYRYYVQDVNMSSLIASFSGGKLTLTMKFEDNGTEIKGRCHGSTLENTTLCAVGSDSAAPDIQMNNTRITVTLSPTADHGKLTYNPDVDVKFYAYIQAQGVCSAIDVCQLLTHYKSTIRSAVVDSVRSNIANNNLRNEVATALTNTLRAKGVEKVITAKGNGGNIEIVYLPK